jgi:hypothetical protein
MKKSIWKLLGIIALVAVIGLSLARGRRTPVKKPGGGAGRPPKQNNAIALWRPSLPIPHFPPIITHLI